MALFKLRCFGVWMVYLCCLVFGNGENLCNSGLLKHSNVTVEDAQSDVLLPCNFHPTLLGSDKTADIAVVWTQRNTSSHNLLEISLQGDVRFWDKKCERIKTFPKLSESGNFSILLQKVQLYDLSLYRCELFKGFNCSIAYQEIQLGLTTLSQPHKSLITAALIVGVLLCLFITCLCSKSDNQNEKPQPESSRENGYTDVMYTPQSTKQP